VKKPISSGRTEKVERWAAVLFAIVSPGHTERKANSKPHVNTGIVILSTSKSTYEHLSEQGKECCNRRRRSKNSVT